MAIDALIQKINHLKAPIVVGLDPQLDFMPTFLKENIFKEHGHTPSAVAKIFYEFNKEIIDNVYQIAPCVKLQIAMYEMYGPHGLDCYIKTVAYAKEKGMIVIGDIKRGDIASTATAYSRGHIGEVTIQGQNHKIYNSDFVTLNPYMGYDAIEPFLQDCETHNRGVFILVKTSNPNSGDIQDIITAEGKPIYNHVGRLVNKWGRNMVGKSGFSQVAAAVGATYSGLARELREVMPNTLFLVPGYGAQGASAKDLAPFFTENIQGAIINSSRNIIGAYLLEKYKQFGQENYGAAAKAATTDMIKEIRCVV